MQVSGPVIRVRGVFHVRALTMLNGTAVLNIALGIIAGVAQLVEQLTCNQQVDGSSPPASSSAHPALVRAARPSAKSAGR